MTSTLVQRPADVEVPDLERETATDVAGYRSLGVTFVMLVTSETATECPPCASLAGRTFRLDDVPRPPVAGCLGTCTCRIAPFALE